MVRHLVGAAMAASTILLIAGGAKAQPITYYVQSAPYSSVSNFTACPQGGCSAQYSTSQRITGSFTIFNPLAPNLNDEVIDIRLGDLNLSDGQNTYQTDFYSDWGQPGQVVAQSAQVSTDSLGNLTYFEFKFDLIHAALPTAGNASDPRSYVSSIWLTHMPGATYARAESNSLCTLRGDNVGGNTTHPGYPANPFGCLVQTSAPANGASSAHSPSVTLSLTPPPAPATIPTMSEWAMILLAGLLATFGLGTAVRHQRRDSAKA